MNPSARRSMHFYGLILLFVFIVLVFMLFMHTRWLEKMMYPINQQYKQDIQISAHHFNLDPLFIAAIIRTESNYRTDQKSRKGAIGIMQIMPDTADWIISQAGYSSEARGNMEQADVNIEMGAWYLHTLYQQFAGNSLLVLAAYNAGPGNVQKWLDSGIWDGSAGTVDKIPYGETRNYVQRVTFYYGKYKQIYADEWEQADE